MSLIPLTFYLIIENGDINSHQLSFKARCMDAVLLNAPHAKYTRYMYEQYINDSIIYITHDSSYLKKCMHYIKYVRIYQRYTI